MAISKHKMIVVILVGYLFVAGAFAIYTPDWQAPDEPAHYNYIAQLAAGHLPVIETGDWNSIYLDNLKANRFAEDLLLNFDKIQYEDHQPPLYYLIMTPIYLITDGNLTAIRLASVLIGTIILLSAYNVCLLMFPDKPWLGLGAAAFVAFIPQHVHIIASVNNDVLAWAIVGLLLVGMIAYIKDVPIGGHSVTTWHLGILVGIGLMTKTTTYFMAGVVPLSIILHSWTKYDIDIRETSEFTFPEENSPLSQVIKTILKGLIAFFIPALILGGIWWLRDINTYGMPDFLGLKAHDAVVVGQPRTQDRIDAIGVSAYLQEISRVTFNSFWGQFGWMALPMQHWIYSAIKFVLFIALSGLFIYQLVLRRYEKAAQSKLRRHNAQQGAWHVLNLTILFSVLAYLYYNTEFQQYQGRYMFTALIPLGILLTIGIDCWRRLILPDVVILRYSALLAFAAFAPLDLWLLWRVIIPNL